MVTWSISQRVCFILYSVLLGSPIGFLFLLLIISLYNQKWFLLSMKNLPSLLLVGIGLGGLQALLTALFICWRYMRTKSIIIWDLLFCSIAGWLFGNWINYDLLAKGFQGRHIRFDKDMQLLIFSPLIFGVLMTFILWYLRPKKLVGP